MKRNLLKLVLVMNKIGHNEVYLHLLVAPSIRTTVIKTSLWQFQCKLL